MRALVTGASGFLGRHFVYNLMARGWIVDQCDITIGWDARQIFGQTMDDCIQEYALVVHAAAYAPNRTAIDTARSHLARNVGLDAAMFEWAVRTGQRRVLYLSSCAALDGPDDYGWTKLTGERMAAQARRDGLAVTVVRPYSGYGADQSTDFPFGAFAARARAREDPFTIWGDGQQVRDWIHVDDVVAGALAVAESGTTEPVSLCTGVGTSMLELAGLFCDAAGYSPWFDLIGGAHAGVDHRVGDPTLMRTFYEPTVDLVMGVKRALAWGG